MYYQNQWRNWRENRVKGRMRCMFAPGKRLFHVIFHFLPFETFVCHMLWSTLDHKRPLQIFVTAMFESWSKHNFNNESHLRYLISWNTIALSYEFKNNVSYLPTHVLGVVHNLAAMIPSSNNITSIVYSTQFINDIYSKYYATFYSPNSLVRKCTGMYRLYI